MKQRSKKKDAQFKARCALYASTYLYLSMIRSTTSFFLPLLLCKYAPTYIYDIHASNYGTRLFEVLVIVLEEIRTCSTPDLDVRFSTNRIQIS
jgi:hypothetical protein